MEGRPGDECAPDDPSREEVCDGVDNDADGQIDEGTDQLCSFECHEGRRLCVEGSLLSCSARPVTEEVCNGLDDDCDDSIDEAVECVGEEVCDEGRCLRPCRFNECPDRQVCEADGYCHPLPCEPLCGSGFRCLDQVCREECVVDSECPTGHICEQRLCTRGRRAGTGAPEVPPVASMDSGVRSGEEDGAAPAADAGEGGASCACRASGAAPSVIWMLLLAVGRARRRSKG